MKILYGIVGDGMGHAIRSSVVVKWLQEQGHQVHLVASGRAVDYLKERFGGVSKIWGLEMILAWIIGPKHSPNILAGHAVAQACLGPWFVCGLLVWRVFDAMRRSRLKNRDGWIYPSVDRKRRSRQLPRFGEHQ